MKKTIIIIIVSIVLCLIVGALAYLTYNLQEQKAQNEAMKELAELEKKEMENEYQTFTKQYSELKTSINNDSLIRQLTAEQEKSARLLEELKQVKSTDAKEITRLKKELSTMRAVLRSYVMEIDSLNRLNQNLTRENTIIKDQYQQATKQIEGLSSEKKSLSEKVAIAAQLDVTNIRLSAKNERDKDTRDISKCRIMQVSFTINKNVTASNGTKTVYIRISSPTGAVLGDAGTFSYENKMLQYTMKKVVEYGGQQLNVSAYWNVNQTLMEGNYVVSIFIDNQMVGSTNCVFKR